MPYEKILVGYDGSEQANSALESAYDLVDHDMASKVIVFTSTDLAKTGDPAFNAAARAAGVLLTSIGDEDEAMKNLKSNLGDRTAGHEDITELRVSFGKAHDTIPAAALKEGCGLIVVGNRGLGGFRGAFGSVSSAILRESQIPVLVVK